MAGIQSQDPVFCFYHAAPGYKNAESVRKEPAPHWTLFLHRFGHHVKSKEAAREWTLSS